MSTHIVQFGKHRFICGLFWQSLSRPRELRKEAIELAKKINLDLMVIRKEHGSAQAGYVHTSDGAQSGMLSLAAAVAQRIASKGIVSDGRQQPVHNWLGAFKLPNGKWAYFAVRDESFLPNGDFAGTKEEVLDRLNGDYGLGGWNIIIGEKELEEYGYHNFIPERIQNLIPQSKNGRIKTQRSWALSSVDRKIPWKAVAIAGTVAAVAIAGGATWAYYKHKQDEAARERALEEMRKKIGTSLAPHPWPLKPLPVVLAQACLEKLTLMSPGGWILDEYACDAGQISYKWSRGSSTVGYLLEQVPNAVVELSGDKASLWEPLKLESGQDEQLQESKQLLMPLVSKFQQLGLTLRITNVAQPAAPPPGMEKKDAPKPDWQTFTGAVNAGGVPPTEVAAVLTQPGVRLEKLFYRNGEWTIEGVIYAK